jgi:hypothetical protein
MKQNVIQFLSNVAISASYLFIPILAEESGANDIQIGDLSIASRAKL